MLSTEAILPAFNDRPLRLLGIPLVAMFISAIEHMGDFRQFNATYLLYWGRAFCTTLCLWEGNRYILLRMHRLFPGISQTTKRLLSEAALASAYTAMVSFLIDYVLWKNVFLNEQPQNNIKIGLLITLIAYLIYEAVYFFAAWKQNIRKTEALAHQNVRSQLEALKNQLDPHFLFNNLNTLAALIDDENMNAQEYLERLSDVYRYVLTSNNQSTVALEEELGFLDAYLYLNKIRFRDNLRIEKKMSLAVYQRYIAPLSLQMLVENAIKHNVVSKENPLTITIRQEGDEYLVVENNIQEKILLEKSTRVGLQNIINRYSLLTDRRVEVSRDDGRFRVKIPLLPTQLL